MELSEYGNSIEIPLTTIEKVRDPNGTRSDTSAKERNAKGKKNAKPPKQSELSIAEQLAAWTAKNTL